jgi:hypothetical protein
VQYGKYQRNNQPNYLKIASFTGRIDSEESAVVFGGGRDVRDTSTAIAVMGGLNSREISSERGRENT